MKHFIVWAPQNGWDCIIGLYVANTEEEVWQALCQNIGDTVKEIKKSRYYHVREMYPRDAAEEISANSINDDDK